MEIDRHLRQQLQNKEIPLGEILKDKGFISLDQLEEALEVSQDRELDLVLVSEKADPPVCRIMDYGKFKFEQEKKAKEASHSHLRDTHNRY